MKYAVEMGSVSMIYITKFHQDLFRLSKVDGVWDSQTHRMEIAYAYFRKGG
jgi:hypothetical protein